MESTTKRILFTAPVALLLLIGCLELIMSTLDLAAQPTAPSQSQPSAQLAPTTQSSPQIVQPSPPVSASSTSTNNSRNQELFEKYIKGVRSAAGLKAAEDESLADYNSKQAASQKALDAFSAASDKFEQLANKAYQEDGDVSTIFAPVHAARLEADRLAAEANKKQKTYLDAQQTFQTVRTNRFRAEDWAGQFLADLQHEIERQLNLDSYAADEELIKATRKRREIEIAFVQPLAGNAELTPFIDAFDRALKKLEQIESDYERASQNREDQSISRRRSDFQHNLVKVTRKPLDANTAAEYEELRTEGRELALLEEDNQKSRREGRSLYTQYGDAKREYRSAFEAIVARTK
ncbi:MAG: hypothetical protein K2Z81_26200 [Cyanobacteria bacterium]|nr:hypothetical protein [Cyanobacteriota bacterium]